jgi:hypothetical protein
MKTSNSPISFATRTLQGVILILVSSLIFTATAFGQGNLKNGGVFRNTGTITYKQVQNYNATQGGTIKNSGTINVTAGAAQDFLNQNGAGKVGTVTNYIGGIGNGTIVVGRNLDNNFAGASFDNDSTAGFSTLKVAGTLTNAGTFTTTRGRVIYNSAAAQAVLGTTYGTLVVDGGNTKTISASVTVNDSARADNSTTLAVTGTTTLTLKGSNTLQNSGAFTTATNTTVAYTGNSNQTVFAGSYYNLNLSGSTSGHSKTAGGGISFLASGALNISTTFDTLEVTSGAFDLTNLTNATFANNAGIRISSTTSPVNPGVITNSLGTWIYNATSAQALVAGTYATLTLRGNAAKNFPTGTVSVTGNYNIEGTVGARNYGTGTFAFAGATPQTLAGLGAESFNVLQFSGAGTKAVSSGTISANSVTVAASTGAVTNSATSFTINTGGLTINTGSSWTNNASMTITAGGLSNSNLFTQTTGTLTIGAGGVTNTSTGTFAISSGAAMNATGDIANDGIFTNDGTVTVN